MRHSRKYGWQKPRGLTRSRGFSRRRGSSWGRGASFRRNIDPTLLIAFNRRGRRYNPRRHNLDPTRLTALRRRNRAIDPTRLTAFGRSRRNHRSHRRHNMDLTRLTAFGRRRNPGGYRRNPDPEGNPWGPKLYNPLEDTNNKFKNERHYTKMISKLRRNPW